MDPMIIILSTAVVGTLGLSFGIILSTAAKKLKVEIDPRVEEILKYLPNANCGACGAPGCAGFAQGVVEGRFSPNGCIPGGAETSEKIAQIMGVKTEAGTKKIAFLLCGGDREQSPDICRYEGVKTCRAANLVISSMKSCVYGCLGFGDCVAACPFDAIHMGKKGLPDIDPLKCTGCGKCVEACPKGILKLYDIHIPIVIRCSNPEKLKNVRDVCKVGCIGCSICVRKAPENSMEMAGNLPQLKQGYPTDKTLWQESIKSCPTKCITEGV
ncbi:RnfABCDGE type electron transport complex subunit B [candidate division WOR-3 bacterium]|nr:RnfABCDGE type electron transport complex subunit B [candidate division WOR-3 bacterium]